MKPFLLAALLLFSKSETSLQIVVYQTSNQMIYVLDVSDKFTLLPLKEETYIPIACLNNEVKRIKDVDFTHAPNCLKDSLNQTFNLHISEYVNLNNKTTQSEMKKLIDEKKLGDLVSFYRSVNTSFTLMDLYQNYMTYKDTPLTYTSQYPFLIQVKDGYLPLSLAK